MRACKLAPGYKWQLVRDVHAMSSVSPVAGSWRQLSRPPTATTSRPARARHAHAPGASARPRAAAGASLNDDKVSILINACAAARRSPLAATYKRRPRRLGQAARSARQARAITRAPLACPSGRARASAGSPSGAQIGPAPAAGAPTSAGWARAPAARVDWRRPLSHVAMGAPGRDKQGAGGGGRR